MTAATIGHAAAQQHGYPDRGQSPAQPAAKPPTTASGTTPGAVFARSHSRRQNAAATQQAQQQQAGFAKARAACLEGKGYTVK